MDEETDRVERRGGVTQREFSLLKETFALRFDSHERLDDERFKAQEKLTAERHEHVRARLEAVGKNVHDLRNSLTEIFALPGRVTELVDELRNVPRKEDLAHLSQNFTTQISGLKQSLADEKAASDKRLSRLLMAIGLILTAVTILMKVIPDKKAESPRDSRPEMHEKRSQ